MSECISYLQIPSYKCPEKDDEAELVIKFENDTVDFVLDGQIVFGGDWTSNFRKIFLKALEEFDGGEVEKR